MEEDNGYRLSRKEFVDVLGAIRDIPRIYEQIEKIESHIENVGIRQDEKIEHIIHENNRLRYQLEDLSKRVDESPYVESRKSKSAIDSGLSKDLINIIVKGLTVLGTFGTIIYALVQSVGN